MMKLFPTFRAIVAVHAATLLLLLLASAAHAQSGVNGRWRTIDDHTGKPKSIVQIREHDGTITGTIETLLNPSKPNPICDLCSGTKKNQPVVGLEILWGFHRDGAQWTGGQVLDPETGKVYSATITIEDGGKKLKLRGYIGISLIGRTQYWLREN